MRPALLLLCFVSGLLLSPAPTAAAVTCNPSQLSPCAGAILSPAPPTDACCAKLKEQTPCFCQYKRNPFLSGYINSANGKKLASACEVPIPDC